jgi:hypothetical protein
MFLRQEKSMNTQTTLNTNRRKAQSPLEALAWSDMSDDEFVEKIASEVWKRPNYGGAYRETYGRVGVSRGKIKYFVSRFGGVYRGTKLRREIERRIFERANEYLEAACKVWAIQALETLLAHNEGAKIGITKIRKAVSLVAPRGGCKLTCDIIKARLEAA